MSIDNTLKFMRALYILPLIAMLPSCLPMAAAGTAVVGTSIVEERSAGDRLDDTLILMKIKDKFAQSEFDEMFSRISVTVYEGRVLLTGFVNNESYSKDAEQFAWNTSGVTEVINEIAAAQKDIKDFAKESFIANTIRSKLLVEKNLISPNYKVDASGNTVYLIGVAHTQDELDRAINIARSVRGVGKVVSYVVLKNDPRRARLNAEQDS